MTKQEEPAKPVSTELHVADIRNAVNIIDLMFATLSKTSWETLDQLVNIINKVQDDSSKSVAAYLVSRDLGLDLQQLVQIRQVRDRLHSIVAEIDKAHSPTDETASEEN